MIFRNHRPDPIEQATKLKLKPEERIAEIRLTHLTEKQLLFVSAWTGNLIAAARAAGYSNPRAAAYKLMRTPEVVSALQHKQEVMVRESGEQFARTVPLCRADIIDRLWQLAQVTPERTNNNIGSQVRAAEALERIFALNIDKNDLLKRQLEGRSQEEVEFYVVHGYLPHQEPKPAEAPPPQLPESTDPATAEPSSSLSTQSTESTEAECQPSTSAEGEPQANKPEAEEVK